MLAYMAYWIGCARGRNMGGRTSKDIRTAAGLPSLSLSCEKS